MPETTPAREASLTDRYLAAVIRTVPERQREDVAAELRASIDDQVEARIGDGESAGVAERTVLTELGDPDLLAAGYADRQLYLIGPRFFLTWWRLLKLLLVIVLPFVAAGVALGQTISGAGIGTIIGTTWGVTLSAAAHLVFWTTIVFALLDRTSTPADAGIAVWDVDRLSEPRRHGATLADMLASIITSVLFAAAVLWDVFHGLAYIRAPGEVGAWMPVLDPALWPWWVGVFIALMTLKAALTVTVFTRRGWSYPLATINAVLATAYAIGTVWLISSERLLNPELIPALTALGAEDLDAALPAVLGFVVVGIAVWDALDAFLKARRTRRGSS